MLVGLCLVLSMSVNVFAKTTSNPEKINYSETNASVKILNSEIVKLNINGKEVTAIHAKAPSPTMRPLDPPGTWYLSVHSYSSDHFQALIAMTMANLLAVKFGGVATPYLQAMITLAGGSYIQFTGNDYEDIYYYWQPSYIDPQLPYYIKQYIVHYRDASFSQYVGTSTRYYYSNMTY